MWKSKRTCRLEWQGSLCKHLGVETNAAGRVGLALDLGKARDIAGVNIGVFFFELAGDTQVLYPRANLPAARPVRVSILPGRIETEAVDQVPVDQRMLAGDLGGGPTGDLPSDPAGFQESDRHPGALQQIGCGEPDNSCANDSNIGGAGGMELGIGMSPVPQPTSSSPAFQKVSYCDAFRRLPIRLSLVRKWRIKPPG